jgi:hypothetical protein
MITSLPTTSREETLAALRSDREFFKEQLTTVQEDLTFQKAKLKGMLSAGGPVASLPARAAMITETEQYIADDVEALRKIQEELTRVNGEIQQTMRDQPGFLSVVLSVVAERWGEAAATDVLSVAKDRRAIAA